ncbi:MAG: methylated-DNA--[protein]-cysteine S-methyltransferase [Bryobacteraceae bacterium]
MQPILHRATMQTPVGPMIALMSEAGLCALEFELPGRQKLLSTRLEKWFAGYKTAAMPDTSREAVAKWLTAYFQRGFPSPPKLDLRGTPFERSVWEALLEIPPAKTTTYSKLAESLGVPGALRAVGAAVGRNPISLIVPCHRVVGSDGALRGYGGGLPQK